MAIEWRCPEAQLGADACGLATCDDEERTVADALLALQSAVGTADCSVCRCDTDSSGGVTASDASRILAASVGQPVELGCPACNSLDIDVTDETSEDTPASALAATGDGGVLTAWSEGGAVKTRRFGASLEPQSEEVEIASSPEIAHSLRVCALPDGSSAVAWQSTSPMDEPTPHDYDDTGNSKAVRDPGSGAAAIALALHSDSPGWQTPLGLLFEPDGGVTAIWRSSCTASRETSEGAFTGYTPQGCPLNGVWMRRFDDAGEPRGDAKIVFRTFSQWYLPWEPAVGLPDGRFLLASNNRLLVADGEGDIQSDVLVSSQSHLVHRHDCGAGADRCTVVWAGNWLLANVYDADAPDDRIGLVLRQAEESYEPPLDITIRAVAPSAACGSDGVCLVVYTLVREEEDWDEHYEDTTTLGRFGRAFNVHTGELGPELPMAAASVVNVAPGRFVVTEDSDDGTSLLRMIVVH